MELKENSFKLREAYFLNTYKRYPVFVKSASGSYLKDSAGKIYLDFTSGIGVLNLGHNHPRVIKAIKEQLEKHLHLSNLFLCDSQVKLAKKLCELMPGYRVFFTNSGAESVEGAIKFARRWGIEKKGEKCWRIVALKGSFHGRTTGALSLTWGKKYRKNFGPPLKGITFAEFENIEDMEKKLDSYTCAVILEVVQIEGGGIRVSGKEYIKEIEKMCRKKNILLIIDEIQTGLGRTGTLFAFQKYEIKPDILLLAKSLGGGLPLGAIVVNEKIQEVIGPGDHASTFGGNPLSCAAGLSVVEYISRKNFLKNVNEKGEFLGKKLKDIQRSNPEKISDVRGIGLVWGVDVKENADKILDRCREKGLILLKAGDNTIRFLPPLTVSVKEIEKGVKIFEDVVRSI